MIFRPCKGNVYAMLFLNKADFKAIDRLIDMYIVTATDDPDVGRLRNIRSSFQHRNHNDLQVATNLAKSNP